ncbi:hypothetical protein [Streptomyces sp. NPDC050704]|uniref:hypothetical protein n=1 Tax=Streptomyces sp. NPDC050704 TaxID=3157219 RepID=UPI003427A55A
MTDHAAWSSTLRDLGLRHTAELLGTWGVRPGFKVLDGLWYRARGMMWLRVDHAYIEKQREHWRREGAPHEAKALALLDRAEDILGRDPMGLRRVVVHELVLLLQDHPDGISVGSAVELGVDKDEAPELVAAVSACLAPAGRLDREAAEGILDALTEGQLCRAEQFATRLADVVADQELRGLLSAVAELRAGTEEALARADALHRAGEHRKAAALCLHTARYAVDEPRALTGLLRTAEARAPAGAGPLPVRAEAGHDGVTVSWDAATGQGGTTLYRVLRHPPGNPHQHTDVGPPGTATRVTDPAAVPGSRVRYAVLPLRDGRIAGQPRICAPLLVAPEVHDLALTAGRPGVSATWRAPAAAVAIRAIRAYDGSSSEVPCRQDGFEDGPLKPGTYSYTIRCEYLGPDQRIVCSPGVTAGVGVEEWPTPVESLTGEQHTETGAVRLSWLPPPEGEVLLVPWSGPPPRAGTELPDDFTARPPEPPLASPLLDPAPGTSVRITAVTVLGRRAVAGPSVLVEAQTPVRGITAERGSDDTVRLGFDWPDPAPVVLVGWRQTGVTRERRVTRSAYLRDGLSLAVNGEALDVTVSPLSSGDAEFVISGEAHIWLPPRVRLSYRLVKPGWRAGARRVVEVRAELPDSLPAATNCPDFLLVGRERIAPMQPRNGIEELRLAGDRLAAGEPVRTEIDLRGRTKPYLLRGFLLGGGAPTAQLDHPPPETLVVR